MIKNQNLILATNNTNKIKELSFLLSGINFNLIPQSYFKIKSIKEDGISFIENSILKARYASMITKFPSLSDDSGLIIPKMRNEPGLYSSRYSNKIDIKNIDKLLFFLKKTKTDYMYAFYYCVISVVFYERDIMPITCIGKLDGFIINKKAGINGFGYDSCFYLKKFNCTLAQLSNEKKNIISHRSKAIYCLKNKYKNLFL